MRKHEFAELKISKLLFTRLEGIFWELCGQKKPSGELVRKHDFAELKISKLLFTRLEGVFWEPRGQKKPSGEWCVNKSLRN